MVPSIKLKYFFHINLKAQIKPIIKNLKMMYNFNLSAYLDTLSLTTTVIDVSYKNLSFLPDLSRFIHLRILNCSHNNLTSLPKFNVGLTYVDCSHNNLKSIQGLY
jgi:Leucine-rich repeat (LRR) protein